MDSLSVGQLRADSAGVSVLKGNISLLSPGSSPRVLDDPVVAGIVSGSQDGVVGAGSAVAENSGFVGLPVGGINADRGWLFVDVSSEGVASAGSLDGLDSVGSLGSGSLAGTLLSSVGVGGFSGQWVLTDVVKSLVWPSSVASVVGGRAINQLLFREVGEGSLVDLPVSFNDSGGGEGPAGSARSLVLDWGDSSGGLPVDGLEDFDVLVKVGIGFFDGFRLFDLHQVDG